VIGRKADGASHQPRDNRTKTLGGYLMYLTLAFALAFADGIKLWM
jgi:hypothetical protein